MRGCWLLIFTKRLIGGAHKRARLPRYANVNRARLVLARLCIDRALAGLETVKAAEADGQRQEQDA